MFRITRPLWLRRPKPTSPSTSSSARVAPLRSGNQSNHCNFLFNQSDSLSNSTNKISYYKIQPIKSLYFHYSTIQFINVFINSNQSNYCIFIIQPIRLLLCWIQPIKSSLIVIFDQSNHCCSWIQPVKSLLFLNSNQSIHCCRWFKPIRLLLFLNSTNQVIAVSEFKTIKSLLFVNSTNQNIAVDDFKQSDHCCWIQPIKSLK